MWRYTKPRPSAKADPNTWGGLCKRKTCRNSRKSTVPRRKGSVFQISQNLAALFIPIIMAYSNKTSGFASFRGMFQNIPRSCSWIQHGHLPIQVGCIWQGHWKSQHPPWHPKSLEVRVKTTKPCATSEPFLELRVWHDPLASHDQYFQMQPSIRFWFCLWSWEKGPNSPRSY